VFCRSAIGIFSSFQPGAASLDNPNNATGANIPVTDRPFYRDHIIVTGQNPINATYVEVSLSGNGNLTLPNSTENIAVNSTGSALVNFETTSVIAQEFLTNPRIGNSAFPLPKCYTSLSIWLHLAYTCYYRTV
jgi:hypothetical protein